MDRLPFEIVLHILELAAEIDQHTASQVCSLNREMYKKVLPEVYRHACLSNEEQIDQFITTMSSNYKLRCLVRGVTLLDDELAKFSYQEADEYINGHTSRSANKDWIEKWKLLISIIGDLSRHQRLSTLVLTAEACIRLHYSVDINDPNSEVPLLHQLSQSLLRLDHLVVSHTRIERLLDRIDVKTLTWYGCDASLLFNELLPISELPFVAGQQQEIHIMSGCDSGRGSVRYGDPSWEDVWPPGFVEDIAALHNHPYERPIVNMYTHSATRSADSTLEEELRRIHSTAQVGRWGSPSDTCQLMAEFRSFASNGWLRKQESVMLPLASKEGEGQAGDYLQDSAEGTWILRPMAPRQWCDCGQVYTGDYSDNASSSSQASE